MERFAGIGIVDGLLVIIVLMISQRQRVFRRRLTRTNIPSLPIEIDWNSFLKGFSIFRVACVVYYRVDSRIQQKCHAADP